MLRFEKQHITNISIVMISMRNGCIINEHDLQNITILLLKCEEILYEFVVIISTFKTIYHNIIILFYMERPNCVILT